MTSPLERLTVVRQQLADLTAEERSLVAQARAQECSWVQIGRAMGISKQGAQKRFGERRPMIEDLPLSDPLFDPLFSSKE